MTSSLVPAADGAVEIEEDAAGADVLGLGVELRWRLPGGQWRAGACRSAASSAVPVNSVACDTLRQRARRTQEKRQQTTDTPKSWRPEFPLDAASAVPSMYRIISSLQQQNADWN